MQNQFKLIILIVALFLLQACQQPSRVKPLAPSQLMDLSQLNSYQFNGKMSFSDGQDGGSGSVHWQNIDGLVSARLKAPLGSKSWQITEQQMGAELLANGTTVVADSAQYLISDQLGWQVPWQQLKSWVIGVPYQKSRAQVVWQTDGFVVVEDGWRIEYSRLNSYPASSAFQLPHKMIARKNNHSIKLSIKQWAW
jgi:outer membrane lipoprotein LolB